MNHEYAILYLDDLTLVKFGTRDEIKNAISDAHLVNRPIQTFRYRERAGVMLWSPQETQFFEYA